MAQIALSENPQEVDAAVLSDIAVAADLPPGDICLLVGDPLLGPEHQAVSIPWAFVRFLDNIGGLENHREAAWDCGVIVGEEWAMRQPEYPAYFAYLLGHEFGHAKTVLTDLRLVAYEALIFDVPRFSDRTGWRWDEMPHEIRYDQFGLAIAEAVYDRTQIRNEIQALIDSGQERDEKRLGKLLDLDPRIDLDGLRSDMADFALPYRDELLAKWAEDQKGLSPGALRYLPDLDALWHAT